MTNETPLPVRRTVDLAADHLREGVLTGRWAPGEHLPAERELSISLGISRPTLRAAIGRIEGEGLLRARQGAGVEVLDWREQAGVELLEHLIASGRTELLAPFLELRRALAAEAVASCCTRATDAELDALEVLADRLQCGPRAELIEGNIRFAEQVVRLAGNLPLRLLFNTVARILRSRPELGDALLRDEAAVRASYRTIVALLRGRDPVWARDLVRRALEDLDRAALETR